MLRVDLPHKRFAGPESPAPTSLRRVHKLSSQAHKQVVDSRAVSCAWQDMKLIANHARSMWAGFAVFFLSTSAGDGLRLRAPWRHKPVTVCRVSCPACEKCQQFRQGRPAHSKTARHAALCRPGFHAQRVEASRIGVKGGLALLQVGFAQQPARTRHETGVEKVPLGQALAPDRSCITGEGKPCAALHIAVRRDRYSRLIHTAFCATGPRANRVWPDAGCNSGAAGSQPKASSTQTSAAGSDWQSFKLPEWRGPVPGLATPGT